MPLVFEKQTVWTRAMPITPRSAGIDGGCGTSTVSARSEFAKTTVPGNADDGPAEGDCRTLGEGLASRCGLANAGAEAAFTACGWGTRARECPHDCSVVVGLDYSWAPEPAS